MFDLLIESYQNIIQYTMYISVFIYLFLTIKYSCLHAFSFHQPQINTLKQVYILQTPIQNYSVTVHVVQMISWLPKTVRRLDRKNEDEDYDYSSSKVSKMKMYF